MTPRNCEPGKWAQVQINIDLASGEIVLMYGAGGATHVAPLSIELVRALCDETYNTRLREIEAYKAWQAARAKPTLKKLDEDFEL